MLADRSYMRSDYPRGRTSALVWIVALTIAAFVLQLVLDSPWFARGGRMLNELPLTIPGLMDWHLWTLLTHGLLHSTNTPFHILFTALGLIFVGRELEPLLGPRRFVAVYVTSIITGALVWAAVHWTHGGAHIGAGAGIFGMFVVLALLYPNQEINFLVMFLIPVRVRPIYLVYALLVIDGFILCFYEIHGSNRYAASAHLGGMLAGWAYFRFFHATRGMDRAADFSFRIPAWLQRKKSEAKAPTPLSVVKPAKPSPNLRAEVDRILDKINSDGFGALTDDEKRILDEAKDMLTRP